MNLGTSFFKLRFLFISCKFPLTKTGPQNFHVLTFRQQFSCFLVVDAKMHHRLFVQASFPLIPLVLLLVLLLLLLLLLLSLLRLSLVVLETLAVSFHLLLVAAYSQL